MTSEKKTLLIYIDKCVTGCILVFTLSFLLHYPDITWCIISAMLVLTPESSEAIPLAITRIKANLIGGAASFLCLIFFPANPVTIILVIAITILTCYFFKLMPGSRAAIAAVIIIMLHGMEYTQESFWFVTLERITSVVVGCVLGLLITLLFHWEYFRRKNIPVKPEEA